MSLNYTAQTQMKLVALNLLDPQATRMVMPKRMPPGPVFSSDPPALCTRSVNQSVRVKEVSALSPVLKPYKKSLTIPRPIKLITKAPSIQEKEGKIFKLPKAPFEGSEDLNCFVDEASSMQPKEASGCDSALFNKQFAAISRSSNEKPQVLAPPVCKQDTAEEQIQKDYLNIMRSRKLLPPTKKLLSAKKLMKKDKDSVVDLIIEPKISEEVEKQRLLNFSELYPSESLKVTVQLQRDLAINSGCFTFFKNSYILNLNVTNTALATAQRALLPQIIPTLPFPQSYPFFTFQS